MTETDRISIPSDQQLRLAGSSKGSTLTTHLPRKTLRTLIALFSLTFLLPLAGQVRINEIVASASDRILQRTAGSHPKVGNLTPWQDPGFDDSAWRSGNSPFGYGTFSGLTFNTNTGLEMQNRVASLYLRKTFTATAGQASSTAALELLARYNDGFIAYLNGVEVARRNMGNPAMFAFHDQTAFNANAATAVETIIARRRKHPPAGRIEHPLHPGP